jgi:hypothetical protein
MFYLMRKFQVEINAVLKEAGKAFIVTEFCRMANEKSMSTQAESLWVLSVYRPQTVKENK